MVTNNSCDIVENPGNALIQYTEGNWTPTIAGTTTAGTGTYTVQVGKYTRIGNLVFVNAQITWTAHNGTGNMLVTGLPFTIRNVANQIPEWIINIVNISFPAGGLYCMGEGAINTTQIALTSVRTNNTNNPIVMDTAATVTFQGWYVT